MERGEISRCGVSSLTSDEDVGGEEEGEDAAHEDPLRGRRRLRRRGRVGLAGGGHRDGAGNGRSRPDAGGGCGGLTAVRRLPEPLVKIYI